MVSALFLKWLLNSLLHSLAEDVGPAQHFASAPSRAYEPQSSSDLLEARASREPQPEEQHNQHQEHQEQQKQQQGEKQGEQLEQPGMHKELQQQEQQLELQGLQQQQREQRLEKLQEPAGPPGQQEVHMEQETKEPYERHELQKPYELKETQAPQESQEPPKPMELRDPEEPQTARKTSKSAQSEISGMSEAFGTHTIEHQSTPINTKAKEVEQKDSLYQKERSNGNHDLKESEEPSKPPELLDNQDPSEPQQFQKPQNLFEGEANQRQQQLQEPQEQVEALQTESKGEYGEGWKWKSSEVEFEGVDKHDQYTFSTEAEKAFEEIYDNVLSGLDDGAELDQRLASTKGEHAAKEDAHSGGSGNFAGDEPASERIAMEGEKGIHSRTAEHGQVAQSEQKPQNSRGMELEGQQVLFEDEGKLPNMYYPYYQDHSLQDDWDMKVETDVRNFSPSVSNSDDKLHEREVSAEKIDHRSDRTETSGSQQRPNENSNLHGVEGSKHQDDELHQAHRQHHDAWHHLSDEPDDTNDTTITDASLFNMFPDVFDFKLQKDDYLVPDHITQATEEQKSLEEIATRPGLGLRRLDHITPATEVTSYPMIETWAGGHGQGSSANQLNHPHGVHVLGGEVFVADTWNHRVQKWRTWQHPHMATSGAAPTTVAGGNGPGNKYNQLRFPRTVVVSMTGAVFVCDTGNHRIIRFDPGQTDGVIVAGRRGERLDNQQSVAGYDPNCCRSGGKPGQLNDPKDVHIDSDGYVWVADTGNHRIQRWTPPDNLNAVVVTPAPDTPLEYPSGVYVDSNGGIYVADTGNDRVVRWPSIGTAPVVMAGGQGRGFSPSQLVQPTDIWVDETKNPKESFVSDTYNHRIVKHRVMAFGLDPLAETVSGECLRNPPYIAPCIRGGRHYPDNPGPGRPDHINPSKDNPPVYHFWGQGGIFVNPNGYNITVADTYNHRVMHWIGAR